MKRKVIRAVGALNILAANTILIFDTTKDLAEIIPLKIYKVSLNRLYCWSDPEAQKLIKAEISKGSFEFIILFYEKE